MFNDERDYIILNENAYFYKKKQKASISKSRINRAFQSASASVGRLGNYLLKKIDKSVKVGDVYIKYSICVFKFKRTPSFLSRNVQNWIEVKLAYFLIVEIDEFVVISKKNISGINDLLSILSPIDYSILSSLFVDVDTSFEQFSLQNMNISNTSVRNKNVSAENLKDNFSPLGAGSYVLKNLRVKTKSEKITLALNTSRINKFGIKNGIVDFITWANKIKIKIISHNTQESFLSIFAEPQDFEKVKDTLIPIAILLDTNQILDDINEGIIQKGVIKFDGLEREIDLAKILGKFSKLLQVNVINEDENILYKIENNITSDFYVRKNTKSITLISRKLKCVKLIMNDGVEKNILDYFNQKNDFILNFEDLEFVYTKRKLFKDVKLLGNINNFLKILKPENQLNYTITEKGILDELSTEFSNVSVFNFVENKFKNKYDFFICDDLDKEWADHIGISENTISFFHSKSKNSLFSASDFQDIIGQAQKNFGNLIPTNGQLSWKKGVWERPYRSDTQINKLRKGSDVTSAINTWKIAMRNPNLKREVYIVVDFISESGLKEKLVKLKNKENFREKNEVIQILWFISSLVSSSLELGIDTYICCKP